MHAILLGTCFNKKILNIPTPIAPMPARIRTMRKGFENFSRKAAEIIIENR